MEYMYPREMYVSDSSVGFVVSQSPLPTVKMFPTSVPERYSVSYCVAVQVLEVLFLSVYLIHLQSFPDLPPFRTAVAVQSSMQWYNMLIDLAWTCAVVAPLTSSIRAVPTRYIPGNKRKPEWIIIAIPQFFTCGLAIDPLRLNSVAHSMYFACMFP